MKKIHSISLAFALLLAACVSLPAPVGFTTSAPRVRIAQAISELMVEGRAELVQESPSLLVFEGQASNAANFFYTNLATGQGPKVRVRWNLLDVGETRRVTVSMTLLTPSAWGGAPHEHPLDNGRDKKVIERFISHLSLKLNEAP